ncbi:hypothetical protein [Anaerosinus sp.]
MEITILCISIASLIANIGVIGILVVVFCSGAMIDKNNEKEIAELKRQLEERQNR